MKKRRSERAFPFGGFHKGKSKSFGLVVVPLAHSQVISEISTRKGRQLRENNTPSFFYTSWSTLMR